MKYFLLSFLITITSVLSFETLAADETLNYTGSESARSACYAFNSANKREYKTSHNCASYQESQFYVRLQTKYVNYVEYRFRYFSFSSDGSCPAGTTDNNGFCEAVNCPASGETVNGYVESGNGSLQEMQTIGNARSIGGCLVAATTRTVDCWGDPVGSLACYVVTGYAFTGALASEGVPSVEDDEKFPPADEPEGEPLTDGDYTKDSSNSTFGEPTLITMPDGSTVETKTDQTIETKDSGVKVSTNSTTKTITNSNGIIKNVITTTTTTTNPDGSKTIDQVINTEYTQTPKDIITVTANGTVTSNTTSSSSGTNTTSTNTSIDSNGNTTGTSTNSSGTGSGTGEGDSDSEEDSLSVGALASGGTGSFWESSYENGFGGIVSEHLDSVDMSNSGFADIGITGNGSIPVWTFDVNIGPKMNFGVHSVTVHQYVWQFIALCFLITTLWLCRALVFGG